MKVHTFCLIDRDVKRAMMGNDELKSAILQLLNFGVM